MKKLGFLLARSLAILMIAVGLAAYLASENSTGSHAQASPPTPPVPTSTLSQSFGQIPISFVPNYGQTDARVSFYIQGTQETIYFTPDGVTFSLSYSAKSKGDQKPRQLLSGREEPIGKSLRRWTVKMDFLGARKDVKPEGLDKTGAAISYFKGKPEEWKAGLPAYSKILYRDLWPGIDLIYKGEVNKLKYEFIVHPGADPAQIQLAYRGTERVEVTEEGRLRMTTPAGVFEDDVPIAYQEVRGERKSVPLAYALDDRTDNGALKAASGKLSAPEMTPESRMSTYGFDVGAYDRTATLVLDPAVIVYCGYIGGPGGDVGYGIAIDKLGNAYITGKPGSDESSFPVKIGPDVTYNGDSDAFVAKVNSSGTKLIYCGYIGGSDADEGNAIAIDKWGSAYITGYTRSDEASFPVLIGPDLTHNGDTDAFVAKVSPTGKALDYCGYIGGSQMDMGRGIAVDSLGNAYITGFAESSASTFPVKVGPDLTRDGSRDVFIAKVKYSGKALEYCGYIGGLEGDWGEDASGIAVDGAGNALISGYTSATESSFPVKVGPDLTYNGGVHDAFVAKVNSFGKALVYCGYLGGDGNDSGDAIAADSSGNAYVTGFTDSAEATFPMKVGPDLTYNGGEDAYVAKVSSSGKALVYCGYIGGSSIEWVTGISVDNSGNAYISGGTWSSDLPVMDGPGLTFGGFTDGFVAAVSSSGTGRGSCGYIGGSDADSAEGIAVDGSGNVYVAGYTWCNEATFPVKHGPDLTYNGGEYDVFVAKISPAAFSSIFSIGASPESVTVTAGQSASYTVTVTPEGGPFDSSVSFSCSGLPDKCTASFSPESLTPGANAVTTTLTVVTQANSAVGALFGSSGLSWTGPGMLIGIIALFLWFKLRQPALLKPSRRWLTAGILTCLLVLMVVCSTKDSGNGGNPPATGTPAGTYDLSVQGESGDMTASTTVTLVVN